MTVKKLHRFMPLDNNHLLVQAAISPPDQAAAAWSAWISRRSLDEAGWAEVRLLPAIAARAGEIGLGTDVLPRLDGIRRFVWAKSQKQMLAARPLLSLMLQHGITPLLLKGAAVIATDTRVNGCRFLRDIDILVRPGQLADALRLAYGAGWKNPYYPCFDEVFQIGLARLYALEIVSAQGGEVDLHRQALAPNFLPGDDDGLWSRSRKARFLNIPCQVPAAEDHLIHTLEHSVRRDPDRVLDWAVDASRLIALGVDWSLVSRIAEERSLEVPVEARLRYLREGCGIDVPAEVIDRLEPGAGNKIFVTEYLSQQFGGLKLPGHRRRARIRAARSRAERRLEKKPPQEKRLTAGGVPEVEVVLEGRRVDLKLPDQEDWQLRLRATSGLCRAFRWRAQLNCGPVRLTAISSGAGWSASLIRALSGRVAVSSVLLKAQGLQRLSLFLESRETGADTPKVTCSRLHCNGRVIDLQLGLAGEE